MHRLQIKKHFLAVVRLWQSSPGAAQTGPLPGGLIRSKYMLYLPITLELEAAIQNAATWFHGWRESWTQSGTTPSWKDLQDRSTFSY